MFRVLVLLLLAFLFFRQIPTIFSLPDSCECGKLSKCIQSAKILSKGSLQYLQYVDKGPSMIEANFLVNILGIPRHEHDNFVVLSNDSISIDWLPASHDVIEPSRSQPLLTHSILLDAAGSQMHTTRITVLFDEINMRMNSPELPSSPPAPVNSSLSDEDRVALRVEIPSAQSESMHLPQSSLDHAPQLLLY
ncbi:hypothetical protein WR25_22900 [Diploscapter pachys]|uniref:Uncharacterized protein n=1 Tax=Diploscapter pachys TaxID=2018661 RepID=A0A2A2KTQ8_9BILA|nr:hypothetical protein WR25_22900 [Diploscapter pachys]